MGNSGNSDRLIFLGSKITADGACSHGIKRHLLLGKQIMTDIDSILKNGEITLPTMVRLVKAMVFPVVMYGCESWTVKKAECRRIDAFELWCWRRPLRVPWMVRRSILKEISPGVETPILWPPDVKNRLIWKEPHAGKDWRWEKKGTLEDEMVKWYHYLNGHEFQYIPGVGDEQGGLVYFSPWGHKESDTTERLNWTELKRY